MNMYMLLFSVWNLHAQLYMGFHRATTSKPSMKNHSHMQSDLLLVEVPRKPTIWVPYLYKLEDQTILNLEKLLKFINKRNNKNYDYITHYRKLQQKLIIDVYLAAAYNALFYRIYYYFSIAKCLILMLYRYAKPLWAAQACKFAEVYEMVMLQAIIFTCVRDILPKDTTDRK
ncbi:hypothetical protein ACJX0J_036938 [Zea mays]